MITSINHSCKVFRMTFWLILSLFLFAKSPKDKFSCSYKASQSLPHPNIEEKTMVMNEVDEWSAAYAARAWTSCLLIQISLQISVWHIMSFFLLTLGQYTAKFPLIFSSTAVTIVMRLVVAQKRGNCYIVGQYSSCSTANKAISRNILINTN